MCLFIYRLLKISYLKENEIHATKSKNKVLYIFNLHFEIPSSLMTVQSMYNLCKKKKKKKKDEEPCENTQPQLPIICADFEIELPIPILIIEHFFTMKVV